MNKKIIYGAIAAAVGGIVYATTKKMASISYAETIRLTLINEKLRSDLVPLVVAQAAHETAYLGLPFNSPVFKKNNNAFGYKYVGSRYQIKQAGTKSPEGNYYGAYLTVEDSARELAAYLKRRSPPLNMNGKQYADYLLSQKYFTGPVTAYAKGLTNWLSKFDNIA